MNAAPIAARIGPNAIIQVADALERTLGRGRADDLLRTAGLGAYIGALPQAMVDEREVIALHTLLRQRLDTSTARGIAETAGRATGDYLLLHRIPLPAQAVLRRLPRRLGSRLLLAAIKRHAWTFAGSGEFHARAGRPAVVSITDCPICRDARAPAPICGYYAATFQRLFERLIDPRTVVTETECIAAGADACRFTISWP